jgi:hypothetical protein
MMRGRTDENGWVTSTVGPLAETKKVERRV